MSNFQELSELLFPNITKTPDDYETMYPPRDLKEGARVTRLAPSPTGMLHFGNLFSGTVAYRTAKVTDGIFFVRVEDTDQKRKVEGAIEAMLESLGFFGVTPDEGVMPDGSQQGAYGPYVQSERKEIYQTYAKSLVAQGLAYPCFCSAEELDEIRTAQENEDIKGYYGKYARCRDLSFDEVKANIDAGKTWTLRLKSPGSVDKRITFDDMIKGKIEMAENVIDVVLLKTDGIPTYHFAHAVDDHLMRTTTVIRGEEWLPSLPKHLQLFRYLGFKPPKYLHNAQIMRMDGTSKKKLSKRDKGAALADYKSMGYPRLSVIDYVFTLLNSNFEDWRRANPDKPWEEFPFSLKKMGASGALFDFDKLNDVSKNVISRMDADTVYTGVLDWAQEYDPEFGTILAQHADTAKAAFAIGRGGNKPRKDLTVWADAKDYMGFFFDELFQVQDAYPETFDREDIKAALTKFMASYDANDDQQTWFDKVKEIAASLGFAPDVKAYKADPESFKGHVGDISMFLRVAVTGKMNAPDLYAVMQILGTEKTFARIENMIETL